MTMSSRTRKQLWIVGVCAIIAFLLAIGWANAQDPLQPVVAAASSEGVAPIEVVDDTVLVSDNQAIRLPFGEWIVAILEMLRTAAVPVLMAGAIWIGAKLPGPFGNLYRTFMTEQLLKRAVDYGVNITKGAVQGKTFDVKIGNPVIASAVTYAIDHGSKSLIEWLGGENGIREMIIARIPLDATVEKKALT